VTEKMCQQNQMGIKTQNFMMKKKFVDAGFKNASKNVLNIKPFLKKCQNENTQNICIGFCL
jgi:hypothetical protein